MFVEWKTVTSRRVKTCLLYHIVCPVKYRREVLTDGVVKTLTETCFEYSHGMISTSSKSALTATTSTCSYKAPPQHLPTHCADHQEHHGTSYFQTESEVKRMLWW